MASSKSNLGQTNKYSGVVKNVQKVQTPEEPRITQEEVVQAFRSFGFEPNERNHNDIGYWTTKGKSELSQLMEELHKRRMEINDGEDDKEKEEESKRKSQESLLDTQNGSKGALPRLSDEDISALFDEYGLPVPDPEWARNHLPNDPKKIRSILEMQRKMADDMLKKHSKNAVNAIPETPKMSNMGGGAPMPMNGTGGPSPLGMQGGMTADETPATPFFIGDHSLVRITNPNNPNASTTWLVDSKKKVLRPFLSPQAFQNAFDDPQEAEKSVVTISSKDLGPGGVLNGFTPLQGTQGVKHDGSMDNIEYSPAQLQNRYGKPSDPAAENKALSILDGVFGQLNQPQS